MLGPIVLIFVWIISNFSCGNSIPLKKLSSSQGLISTPLFQRINVCRHMHWFLWFLFWFISLHAFFHARWLLFWLQEPCSMFWNLIWYHQLCFYWDCVGYWGSYVSKKIVGLYFLDLWRVSLVVQLILHWNHKLLWVVQAFWLHEFFEHEIFPCFFFYFLYIINFIVENFTWLISF